MSFITRFFAPSKRQFGARVSALLTEQHPLLDLDFDETEFVLKGSNDTVFHLGRLYEEYCKAPASSREEIFQDQVAALAAFKPPLPSSWQEAKERVLPVLRSRWTHERPKLTHPGHAPQSATLVTDRLVLDLVFDTHDTVVTVTPEQLATWGISESAARQAAENNLRRTSTGLLERPLEGVDLYASAAHDNYDATRMVLTDFVGRHRVCGRPVVMVPHRDALLLAGDEDPKALSAMAAIAKNLQGGARALCFEAYRLGGDSWEPFAPETAHPSLMVFREMRVQELAGYYADQKSLMDARHARDGTELFVATHKLGNKQGSNQIFSFTTWSKGVDTLLPEADTVALVLDANRHISVPWKALHEICGETMELEPCWPRRYRVRTFPSEEKLAALNKLAIPK